MAMDINRTTGTSEATIASLNSLLRGEISAVETYRQALDKITDPGVSETLRDCHSDHQERVLRLQQLVVRYGGKPSEGSGAWGAFARLLEGGATIFGEKAAVAVLEEGEDHGLKDYREELAKVDGEARSQILSDLLPGQESTHAAMSQLKRTLDLH